jgi:hypothetical protein
MGFKLLFSQQAADSRGSTKALTDDGKVVSYTDAVDAENAKQCGFGDEKVVAEVSKLRVVKTADGRPCNDDLWGQWGYTP